MVMRNTSRGQAAIFLLFALLVLVFLILFQTDLHRAIAQKTHTRNAGDSAALAAARWQGASINLIGELNLLHAIALASSAPGWEQVSDACTNMQQRLAFTGPLTALYASQILAKNNGARVSQEMTALLLSHAANIRSGYAETSFFPEPWTGAWREYADMLQEVALEGIAAGPDNMQFYGDPPSAHPLLNKEFYLAVAGHGWCWFKHHASGLLRAYSSYVDWPPLPESDATDFQNAEIFPLHVELNTLPIRLLFTPQKIAELAHDAGREELTATLAASTNLMHRAENWSFYIPQYWGAWNSIKPDGENSFPLAGPLKEEYDVAGADAVVRVESEFVKTMSGVANSDEIIWTAAAKPFGYLENSGEKETVASASRFVLPAFRDVRLIPVDSASNPDASSADATWMMHIRTHLPVYLQDGPNNASPCRWCKALVMWEDSTLRAQGLAWLDEFGSTCRNPGGRGAGGGTRRGH